MSAMYMSIFCICGRLDGLKNRVWNPAILGGQNVDLLTFFCDAPGIGWVVTDGQGNRRVRSERVGTENG
jgi:hypothetical protein